MRFLQIFTSFGKAAAPDPQHMARTGAAIREAIAAGQILATGSIGLRATAAARIEQRSGETRVEDPPSGEGWLAANGFSLTEFPSKAAAIDNAKKTMQSIGDGVLELIQVSELHPPVRSATLPNGVIPYLNIDGASEAAAFYGRAFGAKEIARMPGADGKRLMHCHLEINGGAFMLADNFPDLGLPAVQRSESYTMQLVVADGDAWWKRALDAGCKQKLPFAVAPWGDKYGQLVDPFGVTWAINTPAAK